MKLSGDTRNLELLKRTYPKIKEHSHEIGKRTYENMFTNNSDIKKIFKNTTPEQSQRLIDTIIFFCEVDDFNLIYDRLDKIAHIHIQFGVKNEYYSVMRNALIKAFCDTLQVDKNDDLVHAWIYSFDRLSQELIHIEDLIRKYSDEEFRPEPYSEYEEY